MGSTWGQHGVNFESVWGQPVAFRGHLGVNLGSVWGQSGVNLESMCGQSSQPYLEHLAVGEVPHAHTAVAGARDQSPHPPVERRRRQLVVAVL